MHNQMRTNAGIESALGQFDAETSARTQSIYQAHHASGAIPQSLNRAILVTFFGMINVDKLVLSLNECARKHEGLRAHLQDGGERWLIDSEVKLPFEFIKGSSWLMTACKRPSTFTAGRSGKQPCSSLSPKPTCLCSRVTPLSVIPIHWRCWRAIWPKTIPGRSGQHTHHHRSQY